METENVVPLVPANHEVKIIDRREIYITGVKKINSFDHEEFLLETTMGILLLKGSGLEILKLDTHDGNVRIKGKITSYQYVDNVKGKASKVMDEITQLFSFLLSFLFGFGFHILTRWHFKISETYSLVMKYLTTILFVINIVLLYVYLMYLLNDGVLHIYFLLFVFFGFVTFDILHRHVKLEFFLPEKKEKIFRK